VASSGIIRVAIYARVSTTGQDSEHQAVQLREFAAKQKWLIVREYCDHESGSKSDRAEFQEMFGDASRRKFDLVVFWSLDRFSREGVCRTLQHLNRLESYGIGFRSFTEPFFDSCGIFKEAVISIMATLAKQERVKRSERTRAALARLKAAGKTLGRPRKLNGEHVAQIARLKTQGLSLRAIGQKLGISDHSVRRLAAAR
jgi:DNA invertase Pin-like site-specific DNA recombinase